jgi:hypothetical protein
LDLKEIESESGRELEKTASFEQAATDQQEQAASLDAALASLREAQAAMDSDDTQLSLEAAAEARSDIERKRTQLCAEVAESLKTNLEQQQRVGEAYHKRHQALGKVSLFMGGAEGIQKQMGENMHRCLEMDMQRLYDVGETLSQVNDHLRRIESEIRGGG